MVPVAGVSVLRSVNLALPPRFVVHVVLTPSLGGVGRLALLRGGRRDGVRVLAVAVAVVVVAAALLLFLPFVLFAFLRAFGIFGYELSSHALRPGLHLNVGLHVGVVPVRREFLQRHDLCQLPVAHRQHLLRAESVHRRRHLLVLEPTRHVVDEILRVQLVVLLHLGHEFLLPTLRRAFAELVPGVGRLLVAFFVFLVRSVRSFRSVEGILGLVFIVLVVDVIAAVVRGRRERLPELLELLVAHRGVTRAVDAAFPDQRGDFLVEVAEDGFFELLLVLLIPGRLVVLLVVHLRHQPVVLLGVELFVEVRGGDGLGAGQAADAGDLRHLALNLVAFQVFQPPNLGFESLLLGELALLALAPLVTPGGVLSAHGALNTTRVRDDVGAVGLLESEVVVRLELLRLLNLLLGRRPVAAAADDVELRLVLLPLLVHDEVPEEGFLFSGAVAGLLGVEVFAVRLLSLVAHPSPSRPRRLSSSPSARPRSPSRSRTIRRRRRRRRRRP